MKMLEDMENTVNVFHVSQLKPVLTTRLAPNLLLHV